MKNLHGQAYVEHDLTKLVEAFLEQKKNGTYVEQKRSGDQNANEDSKSKKF